MTLEEYKKSEEQFQKVQKIILCAIIALFIIAGIFLYVLIEIHHE
ncbi:hypothetical protein OX284_007720 [Flavobacterium sp. SUN046]|nr:hypothetical protein [Flavobacterium sp. SUN046]MEC4049315.1 hypothetical protein [Flavobacterium sp. SUN046]